MPSLSGVGQVDYAAKSAAVMDPTEHLLQRGIVVCKASLAALSEALLGHSMKKSKRVRRPGLRTERGEAREGPRGRGREGKGKGKGRPGSEEGRGRMGLKRRWRAGGKSVGRWPGIEAQDTTLASNARFNQCDAPLSLVGPTRQFPVSGRSSCVLTWLHLSPVQVRCGNWEESPLSAEQRLYAATDAMASLLASAMPSVFSRRRLA